MNYRSSEINRLKAIEDSRFTARDGDELRKIIVSLEEETKQHSAILSERQPLIYGTAETTKKNQEMIRDNQRKIEEAIEAIKRLEPKQKGE